MPGYFMGILHGVSDEAAFDVYQKAAEPTISRYGGKMIFVSAEVEAGDGDWEPMSIALFEFESSEQARKWYNSSDYQQVIGKRLASTESNTVFIDV